MHRRQAAGARWAAAFILLDPFRRGARGTGRKNSRKPTCRTLTVSATYNPLEFIREDEGLAVRDINVLLDALLTPPRQDAHQTAAGTSTNPPAPSSRATWHGCGSRSRPKRQNSAQDAARDVVGVAPKRKRGISPRPFERLNGPLCGRAWRNMAVERQAQVGNEEGGSAPSPPLPTNWPSSPTPSWSPTRQTSSFDPLRSCQGRHRPVRGRTGRDHRARKGLAPPLGLDPQRRRRHQGRFSEGSC